MINKTKKIIIILLMMTIFMPTISAENIKILGGSQVEGNNTPCGIYGGYKACYLTNFRFRVTMVDENGNKVDGTNSVDFDISTNVGSKTTVKNVSALNSEGVELVNNQFKYKYGQNDDASKFKYISLYIDGFNMNDYIDPRTGNQTFDKYKEFMDTLMDKIKDRSKDFYYDSDDKIDFLTLFLSYNGYIEQKTKPFENIDNISDKKQTIISNNYYMLIEPTYLIYYNETPCASTGNGFNCNNNQIYYRYGTASELAEFIDNKIEARENDYLSIEKGGYLAGLSSNFIYNAGCNMSATTNDTASIGFKGITSDANCNIDGLGLYANSFEERSKRREKMKWIYQDNTQGYGTFVTKLHADDGGVETEGSLSMTGDLCVKEPGTIKTNVDMNKSDLLYSYYFKTSSIAVSTDASAYCTDDITYDFNNIISKLAYDGTETKKYGTIITKDSLGNGGTLTVTRKCKGGPDISNADADFKDISMFQAVKLHVYDDDYTLLADIDNARITDLSNRKSQYKTYKITINYNLDRDIKVKSENSDGEGYISFSDSKALFGYSDKLAEKYSPLETTFEEDTKILIGPDSGSNIKTTYSFNIKSSNNGTGNDDIINNLCKFNTKVQGSKNIPLTNRVLFRSIDLSNPFPARDGTSRLAGVNWIGQNNYVYDSIIKNRGVLGESVYDLKPMYTVTLTPTKMLEIREYNKKNKYSDINLKCTNGVMCQSEFLKDLGTSTVTGTCAIDFLKLSTQDPNEYEKTKCAVDTENSVNCYYKKYDTNNDGLVNLQDLKDIDFYTCANKTPVSGGY